MMTPRNLAWWLHRHWGRPARWAYDYGSAARHEPARRKGKR